MTDELVQTMILNAPNMIGFIVALLVLTGELRNRSKQYEKLLELWRECERNHDIKETK